MKKYFIQITPETVGEVRQLLELLGYKSDEPWNTNRVEGGYYDCIYTFEDGEYVVIFSDGVIYDNTELIIIEQLRKLTKEDVV